MAGSTLHQGPGSTIVLSKAAVPLPSTDSSWGLERFLLGLHSLPLWDRGEQL